MVVFWDKFHIRNVDLPLSVRDVWYHLQIKYSPLNGVQAIHWTYAEEIRVFTVSVATVSCFVCCVITITWYSNNTTG
jgi:hypothetical protein